MAFCSPCPGTGGTFPFPGCQPLGQLSNRLWCCLPRRPWSIWFSLCGIMQENLDPSFGPRKESLVIRVLAQIIARQVCMHKEGIREEPLSTPPQTPHGKQALSISQTRSLATPSSSRTPTQTASPCLEPSTQALVALFTELAERG